MAKKTRQKIPRATQWELGFIRFFLLVLVLGWVAISTVDRTDPRGLETEASREYRHRTPSSEGQYDDSLDDTEADEPGFER